MHPLSVEGFCIEGLRDYQFRQTSPYSFEMLAEVSESANREEVQAGILQQVWKVLEEKDLGNIDFFVSFVEEILPNSHTGKKQLIVKEDDSMREKITGQQYDEERALYHLKHTDLDCTFAEPADGAFRYG